MKVIPSKGIAPDFARSLLRHPLQIAADLAEGRTIQKQISLIKAFYRLSLRRQAEVRTEKVCTIVRAAAKCKFYAGKLPADIYEKLSIDLKYIDLLPITTKYDLLNDPFSFLVKEESGKPLIRSYTNGSSGPSALILYDQLAADASSANTWWCRQHHERFFRNTTIHLASDLVDNSLPLPKLKDWARFLATNRFNLFVGGSNRLDIAIGDLARIKINIIHGHPSTMHHLAELYAQNSFEKPRIRYFESSGEVLREYQKDAIENVFGCQCINRYGLAEAGIVAYQTDLASSHLKALKHSVYMEQTHGQVEEVIITPLHNCIFPLLRYKTGDLALIADTEGNQTMTKIQGRVHGLYKFAGKDLSTAFIMDIMNHRVDNVIDFQVQPGIAPIMYVALRPESREDTLTISAKLLDRTGVEFAIKLVKPESFCLKGIRSKFSHII